MRDWHPLRRVRETRRADLELDGRVALVTGAGTRVGRAIAVALGKAGMRVGVHYYGSEKGARQTVDEIVAAGGEARTLPGGVSGPATRPRAVEHMSQGFCSLDVPAHFAPGR